VLVIYFRRPKQRIRMSQFYLTLPSNSSEKYYPDNTLTHYITKLHNDVSLTGDWEVALVDIMYPRNWYNIDEQYIRISCNNCMKIVPAPNPGEKFESSYEIHLGIPSGYYHSILDLVEAMKESITKAFRRPIAAWSSPGVDRFVDQSLWPKIRYNPHNQKVVVTMQPQMTIRFSEQLARILALEEHHFSPLEMVVKSSVTCDIEGGLHALYVYCDVLECVPVGDTMAPLLRIVEITGQKGEMTHIQYDQPRYVPLQKKHFDSIEIDIRDDLGENISFDSGKLIVTLHFRKQKESYFLG